MEPGTRLGRYTLLGKLATGGMAEVYLARQDGPKGFSKTLVVKRILPQFAQDDGFVQMFLDEARLAALINHPNVVSIYELGDSGGTYYMAMEFIDGCTFKRLSHAPAKKGVRLPIALAARVVADACAGLDFAHNLRGDGGRPLNLVHRDVSPENILVTYGGVTKVVDFGIAKAASIDTHTKTGQVKGKVGYMSPEQLLSQPVDRRADVWALGVVLYWVCTGVKPFSADSEAATMQKILNVDPPPMKQRTPDVPEAIVAVVGKALARDAGARYQTAGAMREDLEVWLREAGAAGTTQALADFMTAQFPEQTDENRRVVNALLDNELPKAISNTDRTLPTAGALHQLSPRAAATAVQKPPTLQRPSATDELVAPFKRKRRLAVALAAGSAAVVALAGSGWVWFHGREADVAEAQSAETVVPAAANPAASGAPAPAVPALAKGTRPPPLPAVSTPTPPHGPAAAPVATPAEVKVATHAVSPAAHHKAARRATGAPEPEGSPQAPQVGSGFLDVRAVPWASVYVDGQLIGTTPMDPVEISAGAHAVRLVNDDVHATRNLTVRVVAGQTALVKAKLATE